MDTTLVHKAIVEGRLASLPASSCKLVASADDLFPRSVVEWQVENHNESRIILDKTFFDNPRLAFFAVRLTWLWQLAVSCHATGKLHRGSLLANLDDGPVTRGIAFCSNQADDILVPDPEFVSRRGYKAEREHWVQLNIPWNDRLPVAFWRGGTSGRAPNGDWRQLPRINLCRSSLARPELFDVGISKVAQLPSEAESAIRDSGLTRAFIPSRCFNFYKYHLDIDGNTNAWAGFFLKLLTGSPVLKVASPRRFQQWYYPRLRPWEHYVPVEEDMSDLVEKVEWLRNNSDSARRIGETALALMTCMTYEAEVQTTAESLSRALVGSGRRQSEIRKTMSKELMQKIHGVDIYEDFIPKRPEDLQGWNSKHPVFVELIKRTKPDVIIDVGVWKGGSTISLAEILHNHGIAGTVVAVDTFLGSLEHCNPNSPHYSLVPREYGQPILYEQFMTNVVRRNLQSYIVPLPQTSQTAALLLKQLGVRAKLIHIDAAHKYEAVLQDARAYWSLLSPGGYLIGDDYGPSWPGVIRGACQFAKEVGLDLDIQSPKWIIHKPAA